MTSLIVLLFLPPNSCLFLPSFVPLRLLITKACPRAWFFLWASPDLSAHSHPAFFLPWLSLMRGKHLSLPHPYDFFISRVLIICYNYRLYNWTMQYGTTIFHSAQCPWNLENHCVLSLPLSFSLLSNIPQVGWLERERFHPNPSWVLLASLIIKLTQNMLTRGKRINLCS